MIAHETNTLLFLLWQGKTKGRQHIRRINSTRSSTLARTIFSAHYLQGLLFALTARQPHLRSAQTVGLTVQQTSGNLASDN